MKESITMVGGVLTALLASFVYSFFFVIPVSAEEALPTGVFIVRPAKVELAILPGEEQLTSIRLSNGTALPLLVNVTYEDVASNIQSSPNDEPVKLLGGETGAYPLRELLSTSKQTFSILSGKEVEVPITIRIPKNAEAGGRYGSVVFTFKPILTEELKTSANVSVESRVATLFYVRVKGEVKEEGRVVAFGLFNNAKTTPVPSSDAPLKFQVAYENTGTVHVNPYGRLTLDPIIGKAKIYPIDPLAVIPAETRMREIAVRESLPIGYYNARLELNRGYDDIIDEREVGFFVLPGVFGMSLIVLGIIVFAWGIRRSLLLSKHFVA